LTYLFIGHDLAVVRYVSTIVGVMYFGRMVEIGPADELLRQPLHPYTQQLVAVASMSQPLGHHRLTGELPNPLDPSTGCQFRMRCPYATEKCVAEVPLLGAAERRHRVACHYFEEIQSGTKAKTGPMPVGIAKPSS
jgi:oligopeptide/dipeptide ABC transporter ATP-binding protein